MPRLPATFLIAALTLAAPAVAAVDSPPPFSPALQKALKGRTAGTPVDCIGLSRNLSSTIIDHAAIIYQETGSRWYVNVPAGGTCSSLDRTRAIVTRVPGTRLCSGDLIEVVDLPLGFDYGACPLGRFIPYTK